MKCETWVLFYCFTNGEKKIKKNQEKTTAEFKIWYANNKIRIVEHTLFVSIMHAKFSMIEKRRRNDFLMGGLGHEI